MFNMYNRRYTGSKYKLMPWIKELIEQNCQGESFFDVFAGTGVVTEYLLDDFKEFIINDFLYSNEIIYKGFFEQKEFDINKLENIAQSYNSLDKTKLNDNYMSVNFGNKYFNVFDARLIGYIREEINQMYENNMINEKEFYILISSLLFSMDRIANTCGHYDAYRKIEKIESCFKFELICPKKLDKDKKIKIYREDSNKLAKEVKADITFIDPPYNSRQYSRFYHVLENVAKWEKPKLYGTALKPKEENMSNYCKSCAPYVFEQLIKSLDTNYIVLTYNNTYNSKSSSSKNKITLEQIEEILSKKGNTKIYEKPYRFFNTGKSDLKDHKELLFITKVNKDEQIN